MIPRATYRLQFHRHFPFAAAAERAAYFQKLGISHIYASPILAARPGSMHGYDVVDPSRINPELGGEAGFRAMAQTLRDHGVGIVLDIVPNHMAASNENAWWMDVLANGRSSAFAEWFDIDWNVPGLEGKVLAPFLGDPFDSVLARGDLKLVRDRQSIAFAYYEKRFPLRPEDTAQLANRDLTALPPGELAAIHERQHFQLAWWRDAATRINWRRFFDITDLIALNANRDDVFEATHKSVLGLYGESLIDGVRVDHIDGIADPHAWCQRLRARLDEIGRRDRTNNGPAYVVVEKILADSEQLPSEWQVDGTTGYDFMSDVAALLHAPDPHDRLGNLWRDISGRDLDFEVEEFLARGEVLEGSFVAQTAAAARAFRADGNTGVEMVAALRAILRRLRCYRTYATGRAESPSPGQDFDHAIAKARTELPQCSDTIAHIEKRMSAHDGSGDSLEAIWRFNQLAPSIAAKSVEDRAFYRYGRLLSRNDVGSDPRRHTLTVSQYHARMLERRAHFPHAMLTTATHDHKRGEDARARLAVLSEVADLWETTIREWCAQNKSSRPPEIDPGDEYHLYQTLFAAWPYGAPAAPKDFADRIAGWSQKFLREAGLRSGWADIDESYERLFANYASALIDDERFASDLARFVATLAPAAMSNSIVQTALRCLAPGMPDLYQGSERWDLSLVDPDNRRPVNFDAREAGFTEGAEFSVDVSAWHDGAFKQRLIAKLLGLRRDYPDLFSQGEYRPLETSGARADHLIAYSLTHRAQTVVVVGNLRMADALLNGEHISPSAEWWQDTVVSGPKGAITDQFSGDRHSVPLTLRTLPATLPIHVFLRSSG